MRYSKGKKTIRAGFFPALVTAAALVFWGCLNPFDTPDAPPRTTGKAAVTIVIPGENTRTLLPQTPFSKYSLSFTHPDKATVIVKDLPADQGELEPVELDPGDEWKVTVSAYIKIGAMSYKAAEGEAAFSAAPGENSHVPVNLQMPKTGGTGKFTYTFTLPETVALTSAKLTMTALSTGGRNETWNLLSETGRSPRTVNLPSGYYLMTITAVSGITSAGRTEVVHIYPNMETTAGEVYNLTAEDFAADIGVAGTGASMKEAFSQGFGVKAVYAYSGPEGLEFQRIDNDESDESNVSEDGAWILRIPANKYRDTIYIRMKLEKDGQELLSKPQDLTIGVMGNTGKTLVPAAVYTVTPELAGSTVGIGSEAVSVGEISADCSYAVEGGTVTLTAAPTKEYAGKVRLKQDSLKVLQNDEPGEAVIPEAAESENQYIFVMPAANVTARAGFEALKDLAGLTVQAGSPEDNYGLIPSFDSAKQEYAAMTLPATVTYARIGGTPAADRASVTVIPRVDDPDVISLSYLKNNKSWTGYDTDNSSFTTGDIITIQVGSKISGDTGTKDYTLILTRLNPDAPLPKFTAFSFDADKNQENVAKSLTGQIDESGSTITFFSKTYEQYKAANEDYKWWVEHIENLTASYTTSPGTGVTVTVNDTPQETGNTPNDFRDEVMYTLSGSGGARTYTVIFDSPQRTPIASTDELMPVIHVKTDAVVFSNQNDNFYEELDVNGHGAYQWLSYWYPGQSVEYSVYDEAGVKQWYGYSDFKVRGNSTAEVVVKRPFTLKLEEPAPLLGFPSHKRWNLLANYYDRTMIRNEIALNLAREMDGLAWTPGSKQVMFYLNDEFMGMYEFTEAIKVDTNRVNVNGEIKTNNRNGGYLLEADFRMGEPYWFYTPRRAATQPAWDAWNKNPIGEEPEVEGAIFVCADPDDGLGALPPSYNPQDPPTPPIVPESDSLFEKIQNDVNELEQQLLNANNIPSAVPLDESLGYRPYIDIYSIADWYLVNEFTRNPDSWWFTSVFMYRDAALNKFRMGPVWDFDIAMGNNQRGLADYKAGEDDYATIWGNWMYLMLNNDSGLRRLVAEGWTNRLRSKAEALGAYIDQRAAQLEKAQAHNYRKLDIKSNQGVSDSLGTPSAETGQTYAEQITYLKNWINHRVTWLDNEFVNGEGSRSQEITGGYGIWRW
jgi:hypothetical protein